MLSREALIEEEARLYRAWAGLRAAARADFIRGRTDVQVVDAEAAADAAPGVAQARALYEDAKRAREAALPKV